MKQRLDQAMVHRMLISSRSQAESWIKLGRVKVDGKTITKPGFFVSEQAKVVIDAPNQYVSRAGLKLASVASTLRLNFKGKTVLDVGSSTGGFTDFALQHGAKHVVAIDVGTNQMHPKLRSDERIDLREKTDIREVFLDEEPDIIVIDVSFISLREVLPHIAKYLAGNSTHIVAMVKPQFEAGRNQVSKGVIKNNKIRRDILKDFEAWAKEYFIIQDKADSEVSGSRGNQERFYLLKIIR
ncbi:TlyA family RNA methyltransferase [Candidatus Saccharibacteria bacterium]|nr:TlyA family RNA methyltransferase [Candidatus Saccharibacteria bacterium]